MGLNVGVAVVGLIGNAEYRSLQFLGDTGNVAAKLEEQSKALNCVLVASTDALALTGLPSAGLKTTVVLIAEREFPVVIFKQRSELQQLAATD
jgi:adenylate cyclase